MTSRPNRLPPGPPEPSPTVPAAEPPRLLPFAVCAVLVLATVAAFWGLRSNGFVRLDDDLYVTNNAHVQKGLSGESVRWAFTATEAANWHPVTWLSHMLDVELFGLDAGKHHLTSLLLHILNAMLLFLLLLRMTGALWRSALVAALFALHPLHVESVAWVAERKDVLSTIFWLLTLLAWLAYVRSKKSAPYALALALFALGLMAKPMLVTLPFTLLLLDFWPLRRLALPPKGWPAALRGLVLEKVPFFALSAASCAATFMAQHAGGAVRPLENLPLADRIANAVWAYAAYLLKALWPSGLSAFYPLPPEGHPAWQVLLAALLLAGIGAGAIRAAQRSPHLLFGWLWYLGTLVPVIGLVQVGDQAMADRYTYVPAIGLFVAIAWAFGGWAGRTAVARTWAAGSVAAALLSLSVATHAQVGYWKSSRTLFGRALAVTTGNFLIHNNLGVLNFEEGKSEEAVAHLQESIRIRPFYELAHDNLGAVLVEAGRMEEAISHFREALRIRPGFARAHDDLAVALLKSGKPEEASGHCLEALRAEPDNTEYNARMAMVLVMLHREGEAGEYLERALRTGADIFEAHYSLGTALRAAGRLAEAAAHGERALEMKPDSPLALTLMGQIRGSMGLHEEAISLLERAADLQPDDATAHINLGVALGRRGRSSEALRQFETALRLDPGSARAQNYLGQSLEKSNRPEEAIACFEKAIALDPGYVDAHANLGTALGRQNRFGEAIAHLEKAVALEPRHVENRINLGIILDYSGRTPEALEQFREALRIRPNDARAYAAMEGSLKHSERRGRSMPDAAGGMHGTK